MIGRRDDRFKASTRYHGGDLARVGRHDQTITNVQFGDAASDEEDQRFASQREEGLAWEPGGAQPCRNHAKDGHGGTYKICAVESTPRL